MSRSLQCHAVPRCPERVLRAALALVDEEGVEALTMRRLGRELGVEAMSLYGYVDSKEDLIEGVVEQVFREMPLIAPGPGEWQVRLRRHAAVYRKVLLDHPNVVRLVARRPLDTEGIAAFVDSAVAELRSLGLDLKMADRVLGIIAGFAQGHVSEQVGDELRPRPSAPVERPGSTAGGSPTWRASWGSSPPTTTPSSSWAWTSSSPASSACSAARRPRSATADERDTAGFRKIIG